MAVVGGSVVALGAPALAASFSMQVIPSSGLKDGQSITVTFHGAPTGPGDTLYFDQCSSIPTSVYQEGCGSDLARNVTPAGDGSGQVKVTVHTSPCQQTYTGCYVIAFSQPGDGTNATMQGSAAISFVAPTLSVPNATYADGQPFTATVTGFDPNPSAASVTSDQCGQQGCTAERAVATNNAGGAVFSQAAAYLGGQQHVYATGYAPGQGKVTVQDAITVVPADTPARVSSVTAQSGSSSVTVAWKPITQAQAFDGYIVKRSGLDSKGQAEITVHVSTHTLSYTFDNLFPSDHYGFSVAAINYVGTMGPATTVAVTTLAAGQPASSAPTTSPSLGAPSATPSEGTSPPMAPAEQSSSGAPTAGAPPTSAGGAETSGASDSADASPKKSGGSVPGVVDGLVGGLVAGAALVGSVLALRRRRGGPVG